MSDVSETRGSTLPSVWTLLGFALWGVPFVVWQPFAWWRMAYGVLLLGGAVWGLFRHATGGHRRHPPVR